MADDKAEHPTTPAGPEFAPGSLLPETPSETPVSGTEHQSQGEPETAEATSLAEETETSAAAEPSAAEPSAAILPGTEAGSEEQIPVHIPADFEGAGGFYCPRTRPRAGEAALPVSGAGRHRHRWRSFGLWRNIRTALSRGLPERQRRFRRPDRRIERAPGCNRGQERCRRRSRPHDPRWSRKPRGGRGKHRQQSRRNREFSRGGHAKGDRGGAGPARAHGRRKSFRSARSWTAQRQNWHHRAEARFARSRHLPRRKPGFAPRRRSARIRRPSKVPGQRRSRSSRKACCTSW